MDCFDVRRLLPAYCDAELSAARRAAMRQHLRGCPSCQQGLDETKTLGTLTARWSEVTPPLRLEHTSAARLRTACEAAAADLASVKPLPSRLDVVQTCPDEIAPSGQRTFKPVVEGLEDRYPLSTLLGAFACFA